MSFNSIFFLLKLIIFVNSFSYKRYRSSDWSKKYQNPCPRGDMTTCQPDKINLRGSGCNQPRVLDTSMQHLPSCQMIRYRPVPLEPSMHPVLCPQQEMSNANNVASNNNSNNNSNFNNREASSYNNFTASNSFVKYASIL